MSDEVERDAPADVVSDARLAVDELISLLKAVGADRSTATPEMFVQVITGDDASLRRLGVERIDLYQFHWPDASGTPVEDSWAAMVELVHEGKVRAIGVSNFDVHLLARCEAIRHVDSLQPPFSLINRAAVCRDRDRSYLVVRTSPPTHPLTLKLTDGLVR